MENRGSIAGIVAVLLAGVGSFFYFNSNKSELTPVKIASSKNAWSALTILAHKKDYFKEEGLDVKLEYVQAAKFSMDAILAGDAQAGNVVETNIAFLGFTGNTDVQVIATHCKAYDGAIVARKDAGIATPKDLIGKKIGILQGTTSQIFAERFLEKHGIELSKVTIVNLQANAIQTSLLNNGIDAGSLWQPFVHGAQKQLAGNAVTFDDREVYTAYMNLATNKDWAGKNPKTVHAILKAHIKAEEFAKKNKDEAIEIVAKEVGLEKGDLTEMWHLYTYRVFTNPSLIAEIRREGEWIPTADSKFKDKQVPDYSWALESKYLQAVDASRVEK